MTQHLEWARRHAIPVSVVLGIVAGVLATAVTAYTLVRSLDARHDGDVSVVATTTAATEESSPRSDRTPSFTTTTTPAPPPPAPAPAPAAASAAEPAAVPEPAPGGTALLDTVTNVVDEVLGWLAPPEIPPVTLPPIALPPATLPPLPLP